jgi:hypothetical protein
VDKDKVIAGQATRIVQLEQLLHALQSLLEADKAQLKERAMPLCVAHADVTGKKSQANCTGHMTS